jgi:hypothetical protein
MLLGVLFVHYGVLTMPNPWSLGLLETWWRKPRPAGTPSKRQSPRRAAEQSCSHFYVSKRKGVSLAEARVAKC